MNNDVIITTPKLPDDVYQIQKAFYDTWLDTYPDSQIGITTTDVEEIFKDSFTEQGLLRRNKYLLNLNSNQKFLVAKIQDMVVGVLFLNIKDEYNQLQAIYVLPSYQGRGIGKMFWQSALEFFDPNKDIIVHVATYNTKAIHFYKSLGFVDTGKRLTEERHRMPISGIIIPEMELVIKRS
jgi:ribosomal protein S18 acetylase RimI-like enzyme